MAEELEKDEMLEKDFTEEELLAMSTKFRTDMEKPPLPAQYVRQTISCLWALHRRWFLAMEYMMPYFVHAPKLDEGNKQFDGIWNKLKDQSATVFMADAENVLPDELQEWVEEWFRVYTLHVTEFRNILRNKQQ